MNTSLKYIICGRFFDGVNQELKENIQILVEDGVIQAVDHNLPCPEGAEVIDLGGLTVTPGMIDSHVHYDFVGPEHFNSYVVTDSDERKALNVVHNCMKALQNGYTTVRTTGTAFRGFGMIDAKRAIDAGMFPAARLLAAPHAMGCSGGHWDFSSYFPGSNPFVSEFLEQPYGTAAGAAGFRRLVQKQVKYGADFIKIMAAGGFASPGDDPGDPQLDREEMDAIIKTAHQLGKYTAAHAYTSNVMDTLIELGVDEIEHGTLMQAHTAETMVKKDIRYVPTLFSLMTPDDVDLSKVPPKSAAMQRKEKKYAAQLEESRKIVVDLIMDGSLTMGLGSDMVSIVPATDGWREFTAWRDLGIPALRVLKAGTSDNAKICGLSEVGMLAPGMKADIAAWDADILNDRKALCHCAFVMKDGYVHKEYTSR
ncbi:MAG: amidohydrolase family protein [Clostridium sp.]|jgi:imidazolonepropionase-like amidohydrolase